MLSASLLAEADRKKQLEEELQQSRDEVRSSVVTFGSTQIFDFIFLQVFSTLLLKVSRTKETLDLFQEEFSEQKLLISELQTRSKERQSSLDRQVCVCAPRLERWIHTKSVFMF